MNLMPSIWSGMEWIEEHATKRISSGTSHIATQEDLSGAQYITDSITTLGIWQDLSLAWNFAKDNAHPEKGLLEKTGVFLEDLYPQILNMKNLKQRALHHGFVSKSGLLAPQKKTPASWYSNGFSQMPRGNL
jgi:hypothetical protein